MFYWQKDWIGQEEMATLHPGHAVDDNDVRRPLPVLL